MGETCRQRRSPILSLAESAVGTLSCLQVSGLGRRAAIYLAVEFHRYQKLRAVSRQLPLLTALDRSLAHFNRAPKVNASGRAKDRAPQLPKVNASGTVTASPGRAEDRAPQLPVDGASSLEQNLEKVLTYMLLAANITVAWLPDDIAIAAAPKFKRRP